MIGTCGNPTRFVYNGAGSSTALTDAVAPALLVVIDYICFSFTQAATAAGATITVDSRTVAAKSPGTASAIDGLMVTFPGGYPCWNTSGESDAQDTSVNITGTCASSTGPTLLVAYHHESTAYRRSLGSADV